MLDKLSWTKKKGELLLALGKHEDAEEIYRCVSHEPVHTHAHTAYVFCLFPEVYYYGVG